MYVIHAHMSLLSFYPFWVFVRLQNLAWEFWGFHLLIGSGDFLEFRFKPEVFFFVIFVYVPIRSSPPRKYPLPEGGYKAGRDSTFSLSVRSRPFVLFTFSPTREPV